MNSCAFNEENAILDPPKGMNQEQCESISVCLTHTINGLPVTISCWKVTKEELEEIQKTGRVWLVVLGHKMHPVYLTADKPIVDS